MAMNQSLDEYRLVRPLGRGAMGEVWLAHDTLLDRAVALKLILASNPSKAAQQRFLSEARAVARLTDPNVVTIFRVGESEGRPFFVSEYIRGKTLSQLETPLPCEELLRIAIELSRGLAAAHRKGVLHRDIKADNALIGEDGVVKLVDFGLAKLLHKHEEREPVPHEKAPRPRLHSDLVAATGPLLADDIAPRGGTASGSTPKGALTQAGTLIGTPRYLAPECWSCASATPASDIYSLGVLLYELASGEVPHPQEDVASLRHSACEIGARPLASASDADPRFAAIVDRCLSREPSNRYTNGETLCAALEALQTTQSLKLASLDANPYRGLSSYTTGDQALFFGRARETQALCSMLASEPIVIIAGESGVGKSSLCHAGVLPIAVEHGLSDCRSWSAISLRPGRSPLSALADALAEHAGVPSETLLREMSEQPGLIGRWLRNHMGENDGLIITIDQLEELVTQSSTDEAETFRQILLRLSSPAPGIRVLATVRGDFLTRVASFTGLSSMVPKSLFVLSPLEGSSLRAAIRGPAERLGVSFECDKLVDELAAQVESSRGSLPLLQLVLAQLWVRRDVKNMTIRATSLDELGGLQTVLQEYADGVISAMSPEERTAAKAQLMSLVSLDGTTALRSADALEAMTPAGGTSLAALIESRLVVATGGNGAETTECRLAHDTIISQWTELQSWLAKDAQSRETMASLERQAKEWARDGRKRDVLLRRGQLAELEGLGEALASGSEVTTEFRRASQRNVDRRRLLQFAAAIGIPMLVASVFLLARNRGQAAQELKIARRLHTASALMQDAEAARRALLPVRRTAYALFDVMKGAESNAIAETAWSKVGLASDMVVERFEQSSLEIEAALLMDGAKGGAQEMFAELLFRRALFAEEQHRVSDLGRFLRRLATYDTKGVQRAKWDAKGTLSIHSAAPDVRAALFRYQPTANGEFKKISHSKSVPIPSSSQLAPGSYLLEVSAPGAYATSYPVVVSRGESLSLKVQPPPASAIPEGYAYIPEGRHQYGSAAWGAERKITYAAPSHEEYLPEFLMAQYETTMAEWMRYIDATGVRPLPKAEFWGQSVELRRTRKGEWSIQLEEAEFRFVAKAGDALVYTPRKNRRSQDWRAFPIVGISAQQAIDYASWLRETPGYESARLCTEHEFERAARGADARIYPHGNIQRSDDGNHEFTYGREPGTMWPDVVGSHPKSQSLFGIFDLVGNASEFYRVNKDFVAIRGGGWASPARTGIANRAIAELSHKAAETGFRICLDMGTPPS